MISNYARTHLPAIADTNGSEPFGDFLALWARATQNRDLVPANGDSSRQAGARLQAFLADLAGRPGPAAVVTHGGVICDLLRDLLGDGPFPRTCWMPGSRPVPSRALKT